MRHPLAILLLIVTLVARQAIPLGHAHPEGGEPPGHDAMPHFHLHRHVTESLSLECHSHDDQCKSAHHKSSRPSASFPSDHDHDAVYVGEYVAILFDGDSLGQQGAGANRIAWGDAAPCAWLGLPPPDAVALPPPRLRRDNLPIYMRTLSLRI